MELIFVLIANMHLISTAQYITAFTGPQLYILKVNFMSIEVHFFNMISLLST